jgi:hypothetical protein
VQGDSGSWIETQPGMEWCGVLVASDHLMGDALEADDTIRINNTFGVQLQLA